MPVSDGRLDEPWDQALALAWESLRAGTTPVGAVVVAPDGAVVATGRGRRYERDGPARHLANSHVAHAEINALAQLEATRRWEDHLLLTTLEPCGMCHGAAIQARVSTVVYAGPDPYGGRQALRFFSPQSRRRPLSVVGPLADARGAFATLLLPGLAHGANHRGARRRRTREGVARVHPLLLNRSPRFAGCGRRRRLRCGFRARDRGSVVILVPISSERDRFLSG